MRGWFVTGTDTGVGKTVTAAAICRCLAAERRGAVYVKPVQSGSDQGDDDAALVGRLADVPTVVGPRLGPALAPAVALRLAGRTLTVDELRRVVRDAASLHPGIPLVVEGAGGLLVELGSDGTTCADLAGALGLPLVVATRPGLGTLNHTTLTLREADRRGLEVAGVVVCGFPEDPDQATRTNIAELQRLSGGRLAGVLPLLDLAAREPLRGAGRWLAPVFGGSWRPPV